MHRFFIRVGPSTLFIIAFLMVPLGVLFAYSLGHTTYISLEFGHTLANYRSGLTTHLYINLIVKSLTIGLITGFACLVLAYPLAFAITLGPLRKRGDLVLFVVLISLFSAYIVRVYAWRTLLGREGAINTGLQALGLTDEPLHFLIYSRFAVVVTLVNVLVPLAVLLLYSSLASIDHDYLEAAKNLGASPWKVFWLVILPLSVKGVQAAFALCFIIAAGDYVTPQLVGGTRGQMLGNVISDQFGIVYNWPLGSALSFILLVAIGLVVLAFVLACRALGIRDRPA